MKTVTKVIKVIREEGTEGLIRRIQNKYRLGSVIKSAYGVRLAANYGDGTFGMYLRGAYGRFYWDHLSEIDKPFVFVDIGANQGLYTLCAARNAACSKCYSFEPVPKTYGLLSKNIVLNHVADKCATHQAAISNETGVAQIQMEARHSGGATIKEGRETNAGFDLVLDIKTLNHEGFDALVAEGDLPLFVKVDVEGFEATVLSELMRSQHAGRIREIFYEVDENWVDVTALAALLEPHGFNSFEKIGSGTHYDVLARRT